MKKVLYITAHPKTETYSYSLEAGRKFIEDYKIKNPKDNVVELDLYNLDIPFIDSDVLRGWGKLGEGISLNESEEKKITEINKYNKEFIEADKYIFVTPMWNLSLPPRVKMYIDTLMIVNKTFKYTEQGPKGLLENKKALHIHASGGIYSEGPAIDIEFSNSYLKAVMGFMGIQNYESVLLEGTNMVLDGGVKIKAKAKKELEKLVKTF